MAPPQSIVDKWFMRSKDIILLLGFVGSIVFGLYKYYGLPDAVAANTAEIIVHDTQIRALQTSVDQINSRFGMVDMKQDYTNKSIDTTNKNIDEMKSWLKSISSRIH